MDMYFQLAAAVLIGVILVLTLKQTNPTIGTLLSLTVCVLVLLGALNFLKPVLTFLEKLYRLGNLPSDLVMVLLKVTGISVISEIAALVCTDSGNSSMAQTLKLLSTCVILYLSIPVFQVLMELVQKILEGSQ